MWSERESSDRRTCFDRTVRPACISPKQQGAPLLGVDFTPDPDGVWRMTDASIMPNLYGHGDELADALAEELAA